MDDAVMERLDRIEGLLLQLLSLMAGDDGDDEPGPFGAERDGDQPL